MKRTALRRTKRLRPISEKTAERNQRWNAIVAKRLKYLYGKYGRYLCEYCGDMGNLGQAGPFALGGHHIDKDRNNVTEANCYIAHNACHLIITDRNLKVTREDFQGTRTLNADIDGLFG